jgi:DNA-binding XRE family transcriptional regulator
MNYFDLKWRLSACRVNAGYSQVEVAKLLGVTEQTIISWEAGRTAPKMEYAQKLSELYFIPLAYMDFSKEGNATPIRQRAEQQGILG